jgi:hypothetical protein
LCSVGAGGPPLTFRVRGALWPSLLLDSEFARSTARLALLAPSYFIEFGIYALGAAAFWRRAGRRGFSTDVGKILVFSTIVSLVLGSFVRSTILNNDFGWRLMLFAQVSTFVWTLSAIRAGGLGVGELSTAARACLALGYAATAFAIAQFHVENLQGPPRSALMQATMPDEVAAWTWLCQRLPKGAVVQERPEETRVYSYALYGHFPVAVADAHLGLLFGATKQEVNARIDAIAPIFLDESKTAEDVRAIAARYAISALVVTALDPNFDNPGSWTANAPAIYSNAHVRIYLVNELTHAPR